MNVSSILKKMHSVTDVREKGNLGEEACIAAIKPYAEANSGIILQSLQYPCATNRQGVEYGGNLKLKDGVVFAEPHGGHDEIDIVLITDRRIFLVEVKSYGNAKLLITDDWFFRNGTPYEKDLANQTEKHCRHFYHTFYEYIPDGIPGYIVPVLCSVDKSTVINQSHDKIAISVLNNVCKVIGQHDKVSKYSIDVNALMKAIKEKSNSFQER